MAVTTDFHSDIHTPPVRVTHHRGETIRVYRVHGGVTLHSWRGDAYGRGSLSFVCDDIDHFLDNPDEWTTCAGCGHPLRIDEADYADPDDDASACHEGGCVDEYLVNSDRRNFY